MYVRLIDIKKDKRASLYVFYLINKIFFKIASHIENCHLQWSFPIVVESKLIDSIFKHKKSNHFNSTI